MPFDHDETVAAFQDYYDFLKSMYLPGDIILNPPEDGGWPEITKESFAGMGKTDEVVELLRRLPYPDTRRGEALDGPAIGEMMYFTDFRDRRIIKEVKPPVSLATFEGTFANAEPHQVGLTGGSRNATQVLLDTKSGEVWCSGIGSESDPYKSMKEFLKECKAKFINLEWVPISEVEVAMSGQQDSDERESMINSIRQCYIDNGWLSRSAFDKMKCRQARKDIIRKTPEECERLHRFFPGEKTVQ